MVRAQTSGIDLPSPRTRKGNSSFEPVPLLIKQFILQDSEVRDLHLPDFAFVLPFPFPDDGKQSPGKVGSQYRARLEDEGGDTLLGNIV